MIKTKTIISYWQIIVTDMWKKEIPEENFNKQDLLYLKQNPTRSPFVFKKS